jgi:membrane protein required for colicin V production
MTLPDVNWLDLLLIVILASSVYTSLRNGLTREIIGLVSAILGLFLGIWFYGFAGSFILPYTSSPAVANFCGFVIVFCAVLLVGTFVSWVIKKFLKAAGLSWADYLLGGGFGLLRGVIVSIAIVMAMVAFSPGNRGTPPESVTESSFAPYVIEASRVLVAVAPRELKDGFATHYDQVKKIWNNAVKTTMKQLPRSEN